MRNLSCVAFTAIFIFTAACGKESTNEPEKEPGASEAPGESGSSDKADSPDKGARLFDYPPAGDGPHKGFDLAALRDKLQGTWMVGGTAFNTIPNIWHVHGDELTQIGSDGKRTEHTLELYAPCYAKVGDKGRSSATFVHFVFDGDTLYQGLGSSGVTDGKRTVGCLSAAVYVLEDGKCTAWKKRAFSKPGQQTFESEEGDCGLSDDGKTFYGDDTNSKRKIYGRQELKVRVGDAFMTQQMQGNKAEKMASLEEAIAKQNAAIEAKAEAKRPPSEFPFSAWKLPESEVSAQTGDRLWAAASNKEGKWRLAGFRMKGTANGVVELSGMDKRWAPPAFIRTTSKPEAFKKGMPVAYVTAIMLWGMVDKVDGETVTMSYLTGNAVKQKSEKAEMFLPFEKDTLSLGTPVVFDVSGTLKNGQSILANADDVYVMHSAGGELTVEAMKTSSVRAVDGYKAHRVGAKVLAKQPSGMSPLKWLPAKVTKVHAGGAAYDVTTDDGKKFTQSWAYVTTP